MSDSPFLDRATALEAFRRLPVRLRARNLIADIYIFGGGAMLFAFDDRKATRDIDARFTSTNAVRDEIEAVAGELGIPHWWLNQQCTAYLPREDDPHAPPLFDHPNLRVARVYDRHLLAMKTSAARGGTADFDDIRLLAGRLGLTTIAEVVRLHDEVFSDQPLRPEKVELIRDALNAS